MLSKCQKRKSSLLVILDEFVEEFVKKMFMLTADLKCTVSHYVYKNKAPLTMSQMRKEIMCVRRHIHAIFGSGY